MPAFLDGRLVVAFSSRSVFDFEEGNQMLERDAAYMARQREPPDISAKPGVAWALMRKLLRFDSPARSEAPGRSRGGIAQRSGQRLAGVPLREERGPATRARGLHARLPAVALSRAAQIQSVSFGESRRCSSGARRGNVGCSRFSGVSKGFGSVSGRDPDRLRWRCGAIFRDAERVFRANGLAAFQSHEADQVARPLPPGPFKPLLETLHRLRRNVEEQPMRIRTVLITARSAPAHERASRTGHVLSGIANER